MVEPADRTFGRIDVLLNNAGIRSHVNFGECTRETFDPVVAVNLAAPFFASQALSSSGSRRKVNVAVVSPRVRDCRAMLLRTQS
jgi:NAD(P)-dependent dehydrogenase (short-subunit alcohol dehydrogenase family)